MRHLIALLALLLAVLAAGCTSSSQATSDEPDSVQAVYDRIRAAGVELGPLQMIDLPGFQTQEKAKARRPDGSMLYIYIPVRSWDREAFLPMLETAGGFVVHGDRWVVAVDDRATAQRVAQALHGTVR